MKISSIISLNKPDCFDILRQSIVLIQYDLDQIREIVRAQTVDTQFFQSCT